MTGGELLVVAAIVLVALVGYAVAWSFDAHDRVERSRDDELRRELARLVATVNDDE